MLPLLKRKLAFIDVETSGFNPDIHEILELGCMVVQLQTDTKKFKVLDEFEVKIKPTRLEHADPGALRVNGYTDEAWMFAHTLEQAMTELSKRAEGAAMVAHNISFDWKFIEKAYRDTGVENKMHYQKLDTLSLAFGKLMLDQELKGLSLRALCDYYAITNERAHTALADVRATFEVFVKLLSEKNTVL